MKRILEVLEEESHLPLSWWYLSFAGEEGWRGAIYVEARGLASAVMCCNRLMINPHGEVCGFPFPEGKIPDDEYTYRLLTKDEVTKSLGEECKTINEWEQENDGKEG